MPLNLVSNDLVKTEVTLLITYASNNDTHLRWQCHIHEAWIWQWHSRHASDNVTYWRCASDNDSYWRCASDNDTHLSVPLTMTLTWGGWRTCRHIPSSSAAGCWWRTSRCHGPEAGGGAQGQGRWWDPATVPAGTCRGARDAPCPVL